ncbi:MAG: LCP family protein [Anaerolineaceae bacterium]|nr:LCP family protein [Anaerolineaceae bacterium]
MENLNQPQSKTNRKLDRTNIIILSVFALLAIAAAIYGFFFVRNLVKGWTLTDLPGVPVAVQSATPASNTEGQPEDSASVEEPSIVLPDEDPIVPWDGASRVNVLLMGLDYRDWEAGSSASRTDTMMLLTIDPVTKTAGMLSIPRDMWVSIPGFDYEKINTAYFLGESYKLPGGGPGLAVETVEHFLGVPIDYYAQVDFITFIHLIDELGGIKIRPKEQIKIYPLNYPDFVGSTTVVLEPEPYLIPGNYALAYARARNSEGGDFDRAQRQQEVIIAVRNRILQLGNLPNLIASAPAIYDRLSAGIHTNLTLQQIIQLGVLALNIDPDNIHKAIIGPDVVYAGMTPDGLNILIPIPDEIRMIRDEIFTTNGVATPLGANGRSALEMAQLEGAHISVQNASFAEGLAARTGDYFTSQGLNVVDVSTADALYDSTTVILYNGTPYTLQYFSELMNIPSNRIFIRYDPNANVDIAVQLGSDWANNNTLP